MASNSKERDYVLGTNDHEIIRLGQQHAAWSPTTMACWERAGIRAGHRVMDVGAGPGFAAIDLAQAVGSSGHVTAIERSSRFVSAGEQMISDRGIENVDFVELDLMTDELPPGEFDATWCRWVTSFVDSPATLVQKLATVLRPGGVAVFHEYADYGSWGYTPTRPLLDEYISRVMESWRSSGGEPDVGTRLPTLLADHDFDVEVVEPRVFCVGPGHPLWGWIHTFVESNLARLVELEQVSEHWADAVHAELMDAANDPASLMITPMVMEIIARRRA